MADPNTHYRLEPFGVGPKSPSGDLANLHLSLLPHSPVVALGRRFVESFYYTVLPGDRSMYGAIAYVGDRPAGFIAATGDSSGFMSAAIRRHFAALCWTMTKTILSDPGRLRGIWETIRIMRHRVVEKPVESIGELLSFGVLPDYRKPAFVRNTGIRIAQDLMRIALEQLEERGVTQVRSLVDQDNTEVKLLYRAAGWELRNTDVPGWKVPQVEFVTRVEDRLNR